MQQGRFIGRIIDEPFAAPTAAPGLLGVRRAYFALPDQAWRIDAHLLLETVAARSGWTASLTRYEGMLLGYEEWQNDWWIWRQFEAGAER